MIIMGVLIVSLVPKLQNSFSRWRDAQRKYDVKNIYTALMIYYSDYSSYPMSYCNYSGCHVPGWFGTIGDANAVEISRSTWWILSWLVPMYLTSQPVDPINNKQHRYMYYNMGAADINTVKTLCNAQWANFIPKLIAEVNYRPEVRLKTDFFRGCPWNISWDQIMNGVGSDSSLWLRGVWVVNGEMLGFQQNN